VFAIFCLEMGDQAGQHLGNFLVERIDPQPLGFDDVAALAGDDQLCARLTARSSRAIAVLREVAIGRLLKSLGDLRRDALR